ncbi:MAG: GGDEF domain-containing protein [Magnetococcales bacterium]|nr:GGDEF domain-containing protein [Magnetococcales bacterium]
MAGALLDQLLADFLVEITGQQSRVGLIFSLVRALNRLTRASSTLFYEFRRESKGGGPGSHSAKLPHLGEAFDAQEETLFLVEPLDPFQHPIALDEVEGVRQLLESQQVVDIALTHAPGRERVLFPILNGEELSGVLIQDCPACMEDERRLAEFFIRIFLNLDLVLTKKERDALTGLPNRQTFDETIHKILQAFHASAHRKLEVASRMAAMAVLDIDHFKRINDRFGHLIGDEVLVLFARLMKNTFRVTDFLFRFGGEEFVVILTGVTPENAHASLERFRVVVESYPFPQAGKVTLSTGYVMLNETDYAVDLLEKADKALYYAKNAGRNQVASFEQLVAAGKLADVDHHSHDVEVWN